MPSAPHPPPSGLRVAVAAADPGLRDAMQTAVAALGHAPHAAADSADRLAAACRLSCPDLILADTDLPGLGGPDGLPAVSGLAPVILVGREPAADWLDRVARLGVMAYVWGPPAPLPLAPAIALARRHFDELQTLRRESADLRQALEDRKLVERAKGAVMRRCGLPEGEAYRRLQEAAGHANRKVADVARDVVAADQVFHALEPAGRPAPARRPEPAP